MKNKHFFFVVFSLVILWIPQMSYAVAYSTSLGKSVRIVGSDTIYTFSGWNGSGTISDAEKFSIPKQQSTDMNSSGMNRRHSASRIGDTAWIIGGHNSTYGDNVTAYNIETENRTKILDMSRMREGPGSVAYQGKVYIFGGEDDDGNVWGDVDVYDPETQTVSNYMSMCNDKNFFGVAQLENIVFLMGGVGENGEMDNVCKINLKTKTAIEIASLPQTRYHTSSFAHQGEVYSVGGRPGLTNETYKYDSENDTWLRVADYPFEIDRAEGVTVKNKGYIVGGNISGGYLSDIYQYDDQSDTWIKVGDLNTARRFHASTN